MAKNQVLAFGDFEIQIATTPTKHDRDVKTVFVNEHGEKVTSSGSLSGGSRAPVDGVERAALVGETAVRIPEEEWKAIAERSKLEHDVMRVLETIDYRSVPTERITGTKWIVPKGGTGRGLALLTRALHETDRVAVVKWVDTSREKLGVLRPRRNGAALMLVELLFANDFAEPPAEALTDDIEVADSSVLAASDLVLALGRGRGDEQRVETATDTAVDARIALVESLLPTVEDALAHMHDDVLDPEHAVH